jgi:hypothetical protein
MGVSAALFSGSKCYFFDGAPLHPGHPRRHRPRNGRPRLPQEHLGLGWPGDFGRAGSDAALYSRTKF